MKLSKKIVSDLESCKKIWNSFSLNSSLFDLWDFRVSFYEGYGFKPYFVTLYEKDKVAACIPLWFNKEKKLYEWFGGDWHEDSRFFLKNKKYLANLIMSVPNPHELIAIIYESIPPNVQKQFNKDLPQYFKNIKGVAFEELLSSFTKKHRYNLRYDHRRISDKNPKIEYITDKKKQLVFLDELRKISLKRFHGLDGKLISCFSDKHEFASFKSIIKNEGKYKVQCIVTNIEGRLAAVDFVITYNDVYYLLTGANDLARHPGIGNFMNYIEFKEATSKKMREINAMQEDHNWKHKYFDERPLLKLVEK